MGLSVVLYERKSCEQNWAMWLDHLGSLLVSAGKAFMTAIGTTPLGFVLGLACAVCIIGFTLGYIYLKSGRQVALAHWKDDARIALAMIPLCALVIYGPVFSWEVAATIYSDHVSLVRIVQEDKRIKEQQQQNIEFHKHNLSVDDPVFPNLTYLLQAFQAYRIGMNGKPCVLWITAPTDAMPMAETIAQFSNSVSGCFTFGPTGPGNPDVDEETMDGMVPGAIVLHRTRDDNQTARLAMNLGRVLPIQESFKPLSTKYVHYQDQGKRSERVIWLQFGTNVKWNSERRR